MGRTEHTTAICVGIGINRTFTETFLREENVLTVFVAVFCVYVFVELSAEAVDDHAVGEAVFVDNLQNLVAEIKGDLLSAGGGIFLQLHVNGHRGMVLYEIHEFAEGGYFCACKRGILFDTEIQRSKLFQGHIADFAASVGGSVNRFVVNDDRFAVLRDTDVKLDLIDTAFQSGAEGFHRVFGIARAKTSVRRNVNSIFALFPVVHD